MRVAARQLAFAIATPALCICAISHTSTCAESKKPGPAARLGNANIVESSGLARSTLAPNVFWTHNDSGDAPRIFAFDATGRDLGTFQVKGATHRDWEDMSSFKHSGRNLLAIGDTGDNRALSTGGTKGHAYYTMYIVPEPRLPDNTKGAIAAEVSMSVRFKYEDGPHDCEAIAVDPANSTIYLTTKSFGLSCNVYSLPVDLKGKRDQVSTAKCVTRIGFPLATSMDISADGRRAVILGYLGMAEYVRGKNDSWKTAFRAKPRWITAPVASQREAVAYGHDNSTIYFTSECIGDSKERAPLYVVKPPRD